MAILRYKNHSTNVILKQYVNILSAFGNNTYRSSNILEVTYNLNIDLQHVTEMADVFARQMYTLRGKCDFKRFLGADDLRWLYLLHSVFVYSFLKCVYYGFSYNEIVSLPQDSYAFPGHILLMHLLRKQRFQFSNSGTFTVSLQGTVSCDRSLNDFIEPYFNVYPELRDGISGINGIYTYSNARFEAIIKGLNDALIYLNSRKEEENKNLFQINQITDSSIAQFLVSESNPLFNSHLDDDGEKFFFILPDEAKVNDFLRWNESLFLTRAVDLRSTQLSTNGNPYYLVSDRNFQSDFMIREDVYAITGLKSEMVPYTDDQIMSYFHFDFEDYLNDRSKRRRNRIDEVLNGDLNGNQEDDETP